MSICGKNPSLDALKSKQGELDGLLSGGKNALGDIEAKLNAMKADLTGFLPELPQVDSLQGMLNDLLNLRNPIDILALQAEIVAKFSTAVPDLDGLIGDLLSGGDLCSIVPNVEASPDGAVVEQPAEPKVPEEPPVAEEPVELSPSDLEYGNKRVLQRSLKRAFGTYKNLINMQIGPLFSNSKKKAIEIMSIIYPEFHKTIAENNGTTFDELKFFDYTEAEWQTKKANILKKYPDAEPYTGGTYINMVRERFDRFLDDGIVTTFDEACAQAVARQQAKIANTTTQEV